MLREIGRQLDLDIYPRVKNGGIVVPNTSPGDNPFMGEKEKLDEGQRQRGSETGTWTGAERGQGKADRRGASSPSASVVGTDLQVIYEDEIEAVLEAYPGTRVWRQKDGLWLLSESNLLRGLPQKAVFLTGIPFSRTRSVRSWGFWSGVPLKCPIWIGPRHTNFPDGSVCAFDQTDHAWRIGDPLVRLLDLFTIWAFRHLHLSILGSWPGKQVAKLSYERLTELKEDEYCGCDQQNKLYRDCCRASDLTCGRFSAYLKFLEETGGNRKPPDAIVRCISRRDDPPLLQDMIKENQPYPRRFLLLREQIAFRLGL